jgi:hypothetical protein
LSKKPGTDLFALCGRDELLEVGNGDLGPAPLPLVGGVDVLDAHGGANPFQIQLLHIEITKSFQKQLLHFVITKSVLDLTTVH